MSNLLNCGDDDLHLPSQRLYTTPSSFLKRWYPSADGPRISLVLPQKKNQNSMPFFKGDKKNASQNRRRSIRFIKKIYFLNNGSAPMVPTSSFRYCFDSAYFKVSLAFSNLPSISISTTSEVFSLLALKSSI